MRIIWAFLPVKRFMADTENICYVDTRTGALKRRMEQSIKNRTFILGLISSLLTFSYIFICIYVFFINKKYSVFITYLSRISIILMLLSFFIGIVGLIKAKKGLAGKLLCSLPVGIALIIIIFFIWLFIGIAYPHKISKKKDLERTGKIIELNINEGKYLERIETHCGHQYDGDYYAKIEFPENSNILKLIENNPNWKKSVLPKSLRFLLYDTEPEDTLNFINDKRMFFPETKNCYYYFINRSDEFEEPENRNPDSLLNWEYSYNFTVALFDLDSNIMYIYELDT